MRPALRTNAWYTLHVVRRRHGDRVDLVAELFEHLAVVAETRDVGRCLVGLRGAIVVDVTKRHEVLFFQSSDRGPALAADTAQRDVQLVVWRPALLAAHHVRKRERGAGERRSLEEIPAGVWRSLHQF
jgi:hypothetical protein